MTSYDQYMSVREAMQRLKKSDATIRRYMHSGAIRHKSDRQRRVYLLREDVERIAYEDSLLAPPSAESEETGQNARIAELEQTVYDLQLQIEELRARVEDLTELVSQPPTHAPARAAQSQPRQPREHTQAPTVLPGGLIAFRQFAGEHGIAGSTAKNAIDAGRLDVTSGEWKSGSAIVKKAFDPGQQRAFVEAYRHHVSFHQCEREGCPCREGMETVSKTPQTRP